MHLLEEFERKKTTHWELVMDKKSTRCVKGPRADKGKKKKKQNDHTVLFVLPAIKKKPAPDLTSSGGTYIPCDAVTESIAKD